MFTNTLLLPPKNIYTFFMAIWEYKIIKFKVSMYDSSDFRQERLEDTLNELGQLGWEAVNVFDLNMTDGKSSIIVVSLKRRMNEMGEE